jgi:GNAT superfamily N-acetyltransferase
VAEPILVRDAEASEIDNLARTWYDAWQDAHARIVPSELARVRTLESFNARLRAALSQVRVVGPRGKPLGFYLLKGDELNQLFVDAAARGLGVGVALIDDAEARLASSGVRTAWLACAIGNDRAARFYEKRGWRLTGTFVSELDTPEGVFPLEVWKYEKNLVNRSG